MKPIVDCRFAVVDVETTGIDASQHRVIEIAILTCDWRGTVVDQFETLVRPDEPALTGARAEMVAAAPDFAEVAGDVVTRLSGGVVTGHNVTFDLRFLDAELGRLGAHLPSQSYVCTRELATTLGCDVTNRTLASLCSYFGIPFDRWHTAGDDTTATAAVLAALLERAVGFGRSDLSSVECRWTGSSAEWPALSAGGRVLRRDPVRWPPRGDQPGSRRATEASFRRLGAGPMSPSGAAVVDDETTPDRPDLSASERWWQSDFRGLDGIEQLQTAVIPAFRANDDPELIVALAALADLLRRHGGRDTEVRDAFDEAFSVGVRRGDLAAVEGLVGQWWTYLGALRDTDGQVELLLRTLDLPHRGDPVAMVRAQVLASRPAEPLVAERLARRSIAALLGSQHADRAWDVLDVLVDTLELAGRDGEAAAALDEAWTRGCCSPLLLDRLSRRLEGDEQYGRAVEVCARALAGGLQADQAGVRETLRKRHRRCQQRVAQAATLFG